MRDSKAYRGTNIKRPRRRQGGRDGESRVLEPAVTGVLSSPQAKQGQHISRDRVVLEHEISELKQVILALAVLLSEAGWDSQEGQAVVENFYPPGGELAVNSRLYEAMQAELANRKRAEKRRELLYEVLRSVSGQLNLDIFARQAADAIARYTGWPHVCLAVPDADRMRWVVRGAAGRLAAALGSSGLISQGVIGRTFRTGLYQLVPDIRFDPDYVLEVDADLFNQADDSILRSELAMPLCQGEHLLGVLNLESTHLDEFKPEDIQLVQSLADAIALAMENAALYEKAKEEIAERKRAEERLVILSTHDYLTGLYNRLYFEEQLMNLGDESRFPVSLIMIDLDHFKKINDTLGHSAGDECLKQAAAVLKSTFHDSEVMARIGGDEFAVLLPGKDYEQTRGAVHRIRDNWQVYFPADSLFGKMVGISIGFAATAPGEKLFNTMKRADQQMYGEKYQKRD